MTAEVRIYPASSRHVGSIAASVLVLFRGGVLDGVRVSDIKVRAHGQFPREGSAMDQVIGIGAYLVVLGLVSLIGLGMEGMG